VISEKQKDHKRGQRFARIGAMVLLFLACAAAFPASGAESALKKASFMPLWTPQAQFAGYYTALDKGIYAAHGIDLTILMGGPGHSPAQALESGEADFAVLWLTTAIQQRVAGVRLVNVAQVIQKSSMMLISRKSSGIRTPADMNGKKVGLWGGDLAIPPHALFAQYGVTVREVPQSGTVNLFLRGGIDVTSAMWYNEYHTILNAGIDPEQLSVVSLDKCGMNFPEDGIYTLESSILKDPALTDAFVNASLDGWQYAFAHPDEALDIVLKYMREAKIPANRMHQKWMLDRMRDLIIPGNPQVLPGRLRGQDFATVASAMRKDGVIRSYPDYTTFTGGANAGK